MKSNEAYKTISEVGEALGITASTLRFWEKEFKQLKPYTINSRRHYSQENIEIIAKIKELLYDQGYTLTGAKKYFENLKATECAEAPNSELQIKIKDILIMLRSAQNALVEHIN
jgi:DNA-binding transcriptional MerR regulator